VILSICTPFVVVCAEAIPQEDRLHILDKLRQGERYTDKKENQIFLIYKEIQSGAVAKSYMRKGFLKYEEMRK
jgi:hypothetical protein